MAVGAVAGCGDLLFRHWDLARGGADRVDQSNLYMSGVYWNWVNE